LEAVAKAWVAVRRRRDKWTAGYVREVENSLANHLAGLNDLPVSEISAAITAPYLSRVERAAPEMERKVRQRLRAILDYAVKQRLIPGNPLPNVRRRRLERRNYEPSSRARALARSCAPRRRRMSATPPSRAGRWRSSIALRWISH
jgi:hypothetical protein